MSVRSASFGIAIVVAAVLVTLVMTSVHPPGVDALSISQASDKHVLLVRGQYRDQPLSLLLYRNPATELEFELPPLWPGESDPTWQGPFVLGEVENLMAVDAILFEGQSDSVYASVSQTNADSRGLLLFKPERDLRGDLVTGWSHTRSFPGEIPGGPLSLGRIGNEIWIVGTDESAALECMIFDQSKIRPGGELPQNQGFITDTLVTQSERGPIVAWIELDGEKGRGRLRWASKSSDDGEVVEGSVPDVGVGSLSAMVTGDRVSLYVTLSRDGRFVPGRVDLDQGFAEPSAIGVLSFDEPYDVQSFVAYESSGEIELLVSGDGRVRPYRQDSEGVFEAVYSPAASGIGLAYYGSRFDRVRQGLLTIGIVATLIILILRLRRSESPPPLVVPSELVAPFPRRFIAALIDFFLVIILTQFFMFYFFTLPETQRLTELWSSPEFGRNLADDIVLRSVMDGSGTLLLFVMIAYHAICESLWGRTLGKLFFSLRVTRIDGARPDVLACTVRSFFRMFDVVLSSGLLALVFMLITRRRQRLGDIMGGTVVIREPASRDPSRSASGLAPNQAQDQDGLEEA